MKRARLRAGSSGMAAANFGEPILADAQRDQIGLGKVAVIVRVFFAAHADGFAGIGVVEARLLHDMRPPLSMTRDLARDFVIDAPA